MALAPFGYKLVYGGDESLEFGMDDGGDDDEPFALQLESTPGRQQAGEAGVGV